MALKKKLLCGLLLTALVPLCLSLIFPRRDVVVSIILGSATLLVISLVLKFLLSAIEESREKTFTAPAVPNQDHPRVEPDFFLNRLSSAIQDIIIEPNSGETSIDIADLRQRLREKLTPILAENAHPAASVEEKEVTVIISDLRGFTAIAESYSTREVADMLNRYFAMMCEIIYRYGGIVDKFVGDSIMALFGVPQSSGNDVEHALCCAVEMQIAMNEFNTENKKRSIPKQFMGIGINTGKVLAGRVGSELHSEYTVIGDDINLASRIEAYTLRGQILIGSNTFTKAKDIITVQEPMNISVKGKRDPLVIYELRAIGSPYNLKVPGREVRKSLRVDVDIPFTFQICVGKIVSADLHEGRILNISTGGVMAYVFTEIKPHTNIKFHLDSQITGVEGEDIYGKIIRVKKKPELYEANIEFTAINSKDSKAIKELISKAIDSSLPL